jgi:hypothetical protein
VSLAGAALDPAFETVFQKLVDRLEAQANAATR